MNFQDLSIKDRFVVPTVLEEQRVISQRVDILKAQTLAIATTENSSNSPVIQEHEKLKED